MLHHAGESVGEKSVIVTDQQADLLRIAVHGSPFPGHVISLPQHSHVVSSIGSKAAVQ
jgi:hypothetical protein